METYRQGSTLFAGLLVVIGTLVIVQLWILSASLDALLGGDRAILVPAALASLALGALNAGLVRYVFKFDARLRRRGS